jgi:nucleoside-diphosphate-sugar epimerase
MRTVRVLVTSPGSRAGRAAWPALARAGHDVVTLAGHDVRARGPVADGLRDCEAVLHDPRVGGAAGTRVVLDAAAGRRVVLVSSAAVLGPREGPDRPALSEWDRPRQESPLLDVERTALGTAGADLVVVRPALDPTAAAAVRGRLLDPGPGYPWQLLHDADLARFLVLALTAGTPAGLVHVAGQGTVTVADLAAARGVGTVRVPARLAPARVRVPLLDTSRMHLQFGFTPVADAVRTAAASTAAGWQDPRA